MRMRRKLARNLRTGDQFVVYTDRGMGVEYTNVVTVSRIDTRMSGFYRNRKEYIIHGDYPWWFDGPLMCDSDEYIELCPN